MEDPRDQDVWSLVSWLLQAGSSFIHSFTECMLSPGRREASTGLCLFSGGEHIHCQGSSKRMEESCTLHERPGCPTGAQAAPTSGALCSACSLLV
jgi:hypothetical protein